jgi:hypothetical protein
VSEQDLRTRTVAWQVRITDDLKSLELFWITGKWDSLEGVNHVLGVRFSVLIIIC